MGTAERRERERMEMKELILQTATKQFERNGYEKMTIRSIASEIEYSPRTIYLYFKDKDELLYAMSIKGFSLFVNKFESVLEIKDPFERLQALNVAYFEFAFENPGYYDLMFILRGPMNSEYNKDGWDIGMKSHSILEDIIQECMEAGYFEDGDYKTIAFAIWSFVHGIACLVIRDRMTMYPEEKREQLIEEAAQFMHRMLKK